MSRVRGEAVNHKMDMLEKLAEFLNKCFKGLYIVICIKHQLDIIQCALSTLKKREYMPTRMTSIRHSTSQYVRFCQV